MSDCVQSNALQPTKFLCPWDSPGRILEWGAIPFSRKSSQPRDWIRVSCTAGTFTTWATRACLQCRRHKRLGSILGLGRSPGVGICYPLRYSCLENSMYSGAWQATVHGVTKSQMWLSTHTHKHININLVTQYLTAPHRWKMFLKRRVMEREYKKWMQNFRVCSRAGVNKLWHGIKSALFLSKVFWNTTTPIW